MPRNRSPSQETGVSPDQRRCVQQSASALAIRPPRAGKPTPRPVVHADRLAPDRKEPPMMSQPTRSPARRRRVPDSKAMSDWPAEGPSATPAARGRGETRRGIARRGRYRRHKAHKDRHLPTGAADPPQPGVGQRVEGAHRHAPAPYFRVWFLRFSSSLRFSSRMSAADRSASSMNWASTGENASLDSRSNTLRTSCRVMRSRSTAGR